LFQCGDTALHIACKEGLTGVVQTLCAFGCQVDIANNVSPKAASTDLALSLPHAKEPCGAGPFSGNTEKFISSK
jgi:ankyrin repeat protein